MDQAPMRSDYVTHNEEQFSLKILFKHNFLELNIEFDLRHNSVSCLNTI